MKRFVILAALVVTRCHDALGGGEGSNRVLSEPTHGTNFPVGIQYDQKKVRSTKGRTHFRLPDVDAKPLTNHIVLARPPF